MGPEDSIGSPRAGVRGLSEQPYGFWELNSGPQEEQQQAFLLAETSLQPQC